jgi:hypothetical protein
VTVLEFWELTPRETTMTIEAAVWREERQQKADRARAWLAAALTRARRLPSLQQLLVSPARRLRGRERQQREQEFAEMTAALKRSSAALKRSSAFARQHSDDEEGS